MFVMNTLYMRVNFKGSYLDEDVATSARDVMRSICVCSILLKNYSVRCISFFNITALYVCDEKSKKKKSDTFLFLIPGGCEKDIALIIFEFKKPIKKNELFM